MKADKVRIDKLRHEVFVNGKRVHLAKKEFEILVAIKDSKITMSRDSLIRTLWGADCEEGLKSRTVDQHVARIRSKIGYELIETVSGYGYRYAR